MIVRPDFNAKRFEWAAFRATHQPQPGAHAQALRELARVGLDMRARPMGSGMSDAHLRELGRLRADLMRDKLGALPDVDALPVADREPYIDEVRAIVAKLDAEPPRVRRNATGCMDLKGFVKRVQCADWWARALKRAILRLREKEGRDKGEVCAVRRQAYVTNDTASRLFGKGGRAERARAMLEGSEIESADGDVITLAEAVDASVSNPAIRRGELMTRIRGCDEWANVHGWVGVFTTHTTPSRFHAVTHGGAINPKWQAAGKPTPKDGQAWLCATWARVRAKFQRDGLQVFGFRVAEPHHDGTPHWHMLIWCKPAQREAVVQVMRDYWMADEGDERGASEHRFKAVEMWPGGAAGYIAKYIAKGIDDEGGCAQDGHIDDLPDGRKLVMDQGELMHGGAQRVRAWASAHGIRQFQAIGQPPVTVWRELRRVTAEAIAAGSEVLRQAWDAVNRDGERRAAWGEYMARQGGACVGAAYRVRLAQQTVEHVGRYETQAKALPVGVADLWTPDVIVPSVRKVWKAAGTWGQFDRGAVLGLLRLARAPQAAAQPRTRANNCTRPEGPAGGKHRTRYVFDWREFEFFRPPSAAPIAAGAA